MLNMNWNPGMTLESIEKEAIQQAYRFYHGNKSATSRALDISVRTLEAKMEKYENDDRTSAEHRLNERNAIEAFKRRERGLPPLDGGSEAPRKENGKISLADSEATDERIHLQSTQGPKPKHEVSMPVRKEIQGVPPKHASGTSNGKGR